MHEQLIILLGPSPAADVEWLPTDDGGQPLGAVQRGPLAAAAPMAAGRRVVAFIPAEQIVLTDAVIPGLRGARLRQAVPFALEDRVAADIESLHFAFDAPDADGRLAVAAIERSSLDGWLAAFAGAGIDVAAIVPDCLGLPWQDGDTALAVTPDRALLRDGAVTGFSCERALFEPMLAARHVEPPVEAAIVGDAPVPDVVAGAGTIRLTDGLLPWLAPQAASPALNLLQGEYAPAERRRVALGRWKLPAALAAAWVVLALVGWGVRYAVVSSDYRSTQAEMRATFERVMPGEPLVDARAQIERRMAGASATGGEVLHMLTVVGDALGGARGVQLGAINYRRGLLELTLTAQRAEQLDQLRDRMASDARYTVSIESASSRGEQVEGRLHVRAGGR